MNELKGVVFLFSCFPAGVSGRNPNLPTVSPDRVGRFAFVGKPPGGGLTDTHYGECASVRPPPRGCLFNNIVPDRWSLILWLTDSLTLTDWLAHWLVDSLTHCLIHWLVDSLTDLFAFGLIDWLTDSLTLWVTDWLTHRLIDSLTHYITRSLTHWLIASLIQRMFSSVIDWLTVWLTHSLIDWLTNTDWFHLSSYLENRKSL